MEASLLSRGGPNPLRVKGYRVSRYAKGEGTAYSEIEEEGQEGDQS